MPKFEVIYTDRAVSSLRRIIDQLKKSSLIGGEDALEAIIKESKSLASNPMSATAPYDMLDVKGEYRTKKIWDYLMVFKVEEKKVVILDFMFEKNPRLFTP